MALTKRGRANVVAARRYGLGFFSGLGSVLDVGGTGVRIWRAKRVPGFADDVSRLGGDFFKAVVEIVPDEHRSTAGVS